MNRHKIVRKHMVIPIRGIPVPEHMREAALLVFGPDPPAIQECWDNLLQVAYERVNQEMMGKSHEPS